MPSVASQPLRRITTSLLLVMPSVSLHAYHHVLMFLFIQSTFRLFVHQSFVHTKAPQLSAPGHTVNLPICTSSIMHLLIQPINHLVVHHLILAEGSTAFCSCSCHHPPCTYSISHAFAHSFNPSINCLFINILNHSGRDSSAFCSWSCCWPPCMHIIIHSIPFVRA